MLFSVEPLKIEVKRKPTDKKWQSFDTRTVAHAVGYQPLAATPKLSTYGGDPTLKFKPKGFFYPKKVDDRWWLVDPEGNSFIHIAMCSVDPNAASKEAKTAFDQTFETHQKWAEKTTGMLRNNGFNGTGSWSNDSQLAKSAQRVAYCINWKFMSTYGKQRGGTYQKSGHTGYPGDAIFIFDPEFETFAMQHAAQLSATKDDPWLLGHFSDNELPIQLGSLENFLKLPQTDHGHKAAWAWLKSRRGEQVGIEHLTDQDKEDFIEFMMEQYFSIVSKAIKTHAPNHLYLGCRFHGKATRSSGAFRAAGKHCDVISINLYGAWTPDFKLLENWEKWSGKPFMITEYYAKGVDSGMPNTSGAGWLVKTQKDRGLFYQNFCLALIQSKNCVGWHHFKYRDNDMNDKKADPSNVDSNKGVMSSDFKEYPEFLKLMKELNINTYGLIRWMDQGGKVHT